MLRLSRVALLVVLLAGAFLVLGDGRAEAREGLASWYGPGFEGLPTASGEPFSPQGYTAAHKTLPLGTDLVVSYGGRSVQVTVNDRGPYVGARELDLSRAAARDLGLLRVGVDYVEYTRADRSADRTYNAAAARSPGYPTGTGYAAGPTYSSYSSSQQVGGYSSGARVGYAQPEGGGGGAYVVQPGDTLSELALELGTTVGDLAASNGIADPDVIYAGQTIFY